MVMMSSLGSPLYECVVGEGTSSLNHHRSHCHCRLSYSILMVGHQLSLVCVSYPYVSKLMPVKWMKILGLVCSAVSSIYVEICCHLGKYSCEMKVCSEVCCDGSSRNSSSCHVRSCNVKICGMIWSDFCEGPDGYYSYSCGHGVRVGAAESRSVPAVML